MFTTKTGTQSDPQKKAALAPLIPLAAILPAVALIFLVKQPKEVTAAVYSAYVAMMSVFAAVIFQKKGRRGGAFAALFTCIVFSGVFVVYAYLAYRL